MNSIDEEDRNPKEAAELQEEKEEYDNSEELEEKKRAVNEFNVEDNEANIQTFIQSPQALYINYYSQGGKILPPEKTENRTYDLRNQVECSEFVEHYKNGEYLSAAIILSVFEVVALSDLSRLSLSLMEHLPANKTVEADAQESGVQQDAYISLRTIMSVIGGESLITEDGRQCIGLGKDSQQILKNFFELFPALRCSINSWIIQVNSTLQLRTTFDAYQIIMAFVRIISVDPFDAKRNIFPQLYANPANAGLLGNIVYRLHENNETKEEADAIIKQWMRSDSTWLWRPLCLEYSMYTENKPDSVYETGIVKLLCKRIYAFSRSDISFIARILFQSKSFRTMITEVISRGFELSRTEGERIYVSFLYIKLVRQSYYKVNRKNMELPLVACDTKGQQKNIAGVIGMVMSEYNLRKQLYAVLKAYLNEISGYEFSSNIVIHISAFFYNMTLAGRRYQADILQFLKGCNNKMSEQIYIRLDEAIAKEEK